MPANPISKTRENDSVPEHAPATTDAVVVDASSLSQDFADLLSSFSPQKTAAAGKAKSREQRNAPHYTVRWGTDIVADGQNTLHGFIHDISMEGASIYLNKRLLQVKATLHIHIPPLSITSEPRTIIVSGNIVYVVHDCNQQLFRAAINFQKFHAESDRDHLEKRLAQCYLKAPQV